ncbi:MAG: LytTR family transcriptional regulator [Bacteroidetes bacterium]|nr:LytTR family transcriptional regulator [Bacteroidota bacterium]MBS1929654.1 LytTR family transcriptional regulator [Bacteroidota bacterium]
MQNFFYIRENGKYIRIDFRKIIYIEGCRNYLKIVMEQGSHLVLITMKRLEQLLPTSSFIRIHKSYIVSLEKITAFDSNSVYVNEKQLPTGKAYKGIIEHSVVVVQSAMTEQAVTIPFNISSRIAVVN